MSNQNNEKPINFQPNTTIAGTGFYIPFLEKLKLYQNYLRKQSFWEKNKSDYWNQEKIILLWAWSNVHQHLARNMDTQRLSEIYGYSKDSNGTYIKVKEPEFQSPNRDSVIERMQKSNFGMLEPIMGNLYIKGFAEIVTYRDIAEMLKASEIEQLKGQVAKIFAYDLPFKIHSIVINQNGLLMGELIHEKNKGSLWKYKLSLMIFYTLLLITIAALMSTSFKELLQVDISKYLESFFGLIERFKSISLLITVGSLFVIWKNL